MALEQQLERSEELLETNEQNKDRVRDARDQVRQAGNRVNAAQAQTQYAYSQLQQAIAARNAAQQQASQEENGSVPASYDSAVSAAEAELRAANRELQESRREQISAERELSNAEGALEESSRELRSVASQLQQVSEQYGVNLSRTSQLMNLPYSQLASPLLQQLGIGQAKVDDLRQRIAASLGIGMAATVSGYGGGFAGGSRSARPRAAGGGGYGSYGGGEVGDQGIWDRLRERRNRNSASLGGSAGSGGNSVSRSPMGAYRRINGSHSIEDDLKSTNPKHSKTNPRSAYNINCQRCVMAYEARRRGYDVEALPVPFGPDSLPIMRHKNGWPTVYKQPDLVDCSARTGACAKSNVENSLEQWGDNCRAIVRVRWKPECGGGGHVFIAERVNGITRFVDPQNANEDVSKYFDFAQGEDLYCMRTDNLEFSDKIRKCCKNREEKI